MALAFDAFTSTALSTTPPNNTETWSHTCTGTNLVLFVSIYIPNTTAVNSVTYNGVSMSLADSVATTGNNSKVLVYGLAGPATGANNVVITFASGESGGAATSISFTGASQTTNFGAHANAIATSGSVISKALTTTVDNSIVLDAFVDDTGSFSSSNPAAHTGQTQKLSAVEAPIWAGQSYKTTTTAGSYTMQWDWSSISNSDAGLVVVEVLPAAVTISVFDSSAVTESTTIVTTLINENSRDQFAGGTGWVAGLYLYTP